MRLLLAVIFIFCSFSVTSYAVASQDSTIIKVHILHGSKPAKGQKKEYHMLGGMYGGHVMVQLDSTMYGFNVRGDRVNIFPRKWYKRGFFEKMTAGQWFEEQSDGRFTIIEIPIAKKDYGRIKKLYDSSIASVPYDYAFFGMRCASSCYHILSFAKVFPESSWHGSVRKAFYPRPLRKKLMRLAIKKHYKIRK